MKWEGRQKGEKMKEEEDNKIETLSPYSPAWADENSGLHF